MAQIIDLDQISQIKEASQKRTIVLTGGCFDILHLGHLTFLEKAKSHADLLCVLLESDESIKKSKGPKRPINTQSDRARLLAALSIVDYVVLLPDVMRNEDYDTVVNGLKPAIIATTKGDPNRNHKERQARLINAEVRDVIEHLENQSTTKLIKVLNEL